MSLALPIDPAHVALRVLVGHGCTVRVISARGRAVVARIASRTAANVPAVRAHLERWHGITLDVELCA